MRLGIPPSLLDGRELSETTEYEYARGVLVRSTTTREAEWTEQDRAEVLALLVHEKSYCPCGCGQKTDDTLTNEEGGPQFTVSRIVCRARLALLEAQEAATTKESRHTEARLWTVKKK